MRCHTSTMKISHALRTTAAAALVAFVTGCSLFKDGPPWGGKKEAEKVPEVPALPEGQ